MKNLAIILFFLPLISFGQQNLWSTEKVGNTNESDMKIISKEDVASEVLNLYNIYDYYYDASGFTMDSFMKLSDKYNINKSISLQLEKIKEPTAIAYKDNDGYGSVVTVLFLNKKNIDAIVFSNNSRRGAINTSNRDKLAKLVNSFWSYEANERAHSDPSSPEYDKEDNGFGNASLSLENRRFITPPQIASKGDVAGRVAVEITVNRSGAVISARAGVRGSTLNDPILWERCEKAALGAQLNQLEKAPQTQRGVIMFVFTVR